MVIIPPLARRVFYYKEVTVVTIPLDVEVRCADGVAGHSITTVSNPVTKKVSHLVVADKEAPYTKRLVPMNMIKNIRPHSILLDCTRETLAKLEKLEKILVSPAYGTTFVLQQGYS